jgi:hypothetical protein
MDYKQILQARENRKTRLARPFENFFESFSQCERAGEAILEGCAAPEFTPLLERSVVISAVTAIEVYYRDMLDYIFRYCSRSFVEPKLKLLHPEKYDITDLLAVYFHKIHPMELVSATQSFQNVDRIERVFSKFVDKGLWSSVLSLQARLKETPDNIATWSDEDLSGLKATFELRHELVHDPARRAFLTQDVIENLWKSAHMVFGSDLVLVKVLAENRDPTINDEPDA